MLYLALSAVVVLVSTALLLFFGEPSLLTALHLLMAVGILPLIFGAIAHFVPVLTRSGEPPRSVLLAPLLLQAAGLLVVACFSGHAGLGGLQLAAAFGVVAAIGGAGWLSARAAKALGTPHPCWRWYRAALLFLAGALALVPAMSWWPAGYRELRIVHAHLNILGFIGLTAFATVQVLLPTMLSGPDAEASMRLRRQLPLATAGVLAVAFGAAFWWPLSLLGGGLLLLIVGQLLLAWLRRYGWRSLLGDGASSALAAAVLGLLLLLVLGAAHALGWLNAHDAVPAFVAAFLLPLVSGALSQLLPVWRYPGRRTERRDRMRAVLVRGGALRSVLFVLAGVFLAFAVATAWWLAALGLAIFSAQLARAFYAD